MTTTRPYSRTSAATHAPLPGTVTRTPAKATVLPLYKHRTASQFPVRNGTLTLKEVAKLLKLSERTVYRLASEGELPSFKPRGGAWRFRRTDIEARVDAQIRAKAGGGSDDAATRESNE